MKYIKHLIFITTLAVISNVAQAGVRFKAHNNTKNTIWLRFSGDDRWHQLNPMGDSGGHFNNGQGSLEKLEWFVLEKGPQNWKVIKFVTSDLNIPDQGNEDLIIKDGGQWTWSGSGGKRTPAKGTVL